MPVEITTLQRLREMHPRVQFEMHAITGRIYAEVDGMSISDPFLSECGRFSVTPDYYGIPMKVALIMVEHNMLCPEDEFESDPSYVENM